jgi:hypothetical protein
MAQHHIKLFTQNPLQFYYEFMAKRRARKLALKQVKMNLSTDSKVTAKSGLKTRYELNNSINKIK